MTRMTMMRKVATSTTTSALQSAVASPTSHDDDKVLLAERSYKFCCMTTKYEELPTNFVLGTLIYS